MSYKAMQQELKARGLPATGKAEVLRERLEQHAQSQADISVSNSKAEDEADHVEESDCESSHDDFRDDRPDWDSWMYNTLIPFCSSHALNTTGLNYVPDPFNVIGSEVSAGVSEGLSKEDLLSKIIPRIREARPDFDERMTTRVATNMVEAALKAANPSACTNVDDEVDARDSSETLVPSHLSYADGNDRESEANIALHEVPLLSYRELQKECTARGIRGNQTAELLVSALREAIEKENSLVNP
mmetsp:Transcript_15988/g.34702  ORF Transcript_15988/g.34702 Transcript_15988/m.34702 type:complete len:244 (+) Transcript_15988:1504-2235(+)